jgi:concanavalin A-like lectin/glucanase superfamily protein
MARATATARTVATPRTAASARAVAVTRIPQLYTENLQALWRFEEPLGVRFDSVGGNVLREVTVNGVTSAAGKHGNCASFPGTGTRTLRILNANAAVFSPGAQNFYAQCWINPTAFGSTIYIASKRNATGNQREWGIALNASGVVDYGVSLDGIGQLSITGTAPLTAGVWTHLAWWKVGTTIAFSVNDGTPRTGTIASSTLFQGTTDFSVGGNSGGASNPWNGLIDTFGWVLGRGPYTGENAWWYNSSAGREIS